MRIKNVLIIGGTHGNEWTGVYVVSKFSEILKAEFPLLNLNFELGNPEAFRLNKRFKDQDLNRIFNNPYLTSPSYEAHRAQDLLRTMTQASPCLVIDLHTTTANMGETLILTTENRYNYSLLSKIRNVNIVISPDPMRSHLISHSPYGLIVELGPVYQSVIDIRVIDKTLSLIRQILSITSSDLEADQNSIDVYEECLEVKYPLNEAGDIEASLHEDFLGMDFKKQKKCFYPFRKFTGEEIWMNLEDEMYPIFINESSYYQQNLAFILCKKRRVATHGTIKNASRA